MSWMEDAFNGWRKLVEKREREKKLHPKYYIVGGMLSLILLLIIIDALVK
jgi:hypothetical protein